MSEFTHVISSTALTEASDAAVQGRCPRELLGLSCIVSEYACLCEVVSASSVETSNDPNGEAAVLKLATTLSSAKPEAVMASIDLTGYRADYEVSRKTVTASFNLRTPQNAGLMTFVRQTGV